MNHFYSLLAILPIVAALSTGAQAAENALPTTKNLTTPIAPLSAPTRSEFSSISARNLIDGSRIKLAVSGHKDGMQVREKSGCSWTRQADWFAPSTSWQNCGTSRNWHTATASVRVLNSLYPLKVGARGSYERRALSHTGRENTRRTNCKVTDSVKVLRPGKDATPAFVVVCDDTRRVRTTWYAPGIGPIAFRKVHDKNGLEESWVRTN